MPARTGCCNNCTGSCITEDSPNTVTSCVSCAEIASEVYTFSITVDGFSEVSGSRKLYHGTVTSNCSAEEMVIDTALTCVWTSCRISVSGSVYQWKLTVGASPTKVELVHISGTDHIGYIKYITDTFDCNCAQTFTLDSGEGEGDVPAEDVPETICVRPFFDVCCCSCFRVTFPGYAGDGGEDCPNTSDGGHGAPLFPHKVIELNNAFGMCDTPYHSPPDPPSDATYYTFNDAGDDELPCVWYGEGRYSEMSAAVTSTPIGIQVWIWYFPGSDKIQMCVQLNLILCVELRPDTWIQGWYELSPVDCGAGDFEWVTSRFSADMYYSWQTRFCFPLCPSCSTDIADLVYTCIATAHEVEGNPVCDICSNTAIVTNTQGGWPDTIQVEPTTCGLLTGCEPEGTLGCVYYGRTDGNKDSVLSSWTACTDLEGTNPCSPEVEPNLFELNEVWWTYPGEDNSCPDACLCPCSNCCRFYEIYGVPDIDQELVIDCTSPA